MKLSDHLLSIDPTQVLSYFDFKVIETPYPYVAFEKTGYPSFLIYSAADHNTPVCFNTSLLKTVTTAELFMQVTLHTHYQSIGQQIKAILQTQPIRLSFQRQLSDKQIISHFLRLFPIRSNQYLKSNGFDLDEIQFNSIRDHLFFHNEDTCAMLLYNVHDHKPSNLIYFGEHDHQLVTADLQVCNPIVTNPEFPNLICAFPHQLLLYLHHAGEQGPRFNFYLLHPQIHVSIVNHLGELLSVSAAYHFLHTHHIPLLVHNFQLQLSLIYLHQVISDDKAPFFLDFIPDTKQLTGTLIIAKPAGAWSRRDTSLFSQMNIQASNEFSQNPQNYIQEELDDYRVFRYERFSEPLLQGIRIHFHFKPQLFRVAIEVLLEKIQVPFTIHFTHLNTSLI